MTASIRVLLADDEPLFVDAVARALRRRSMAVETAPDGSGALAASADGKFDVIILDLKMPGLDGVETLKALRGRGNETPVLILSAYADLDQASAALREGAVDYLVKPCAIEDLVIAIEDASERASAGRLLREAGEG